MRGLGYSDVKNTIQASSFGIDSNPINGLKAIYAETSDKGNPVVIGYLLPNQLAAKGEIRLFSTDADGALKIFLWLKADGTIQLGGSSDNLVRYSKLETAFNDLQDKWNAFAATYTPGSPSTLGTPPTAQQSTASITEAKITELKTS